MLMQRIELPRTAVHEKVILERFLPGYLTTSRMPRSQIRQLSTSLTRHIIRSISLFELMIA